MTVLPESSRAEDAGVDIFLTLASTSTGCGVPVRASVVISLVHRLTIFFGVFVSSYLLGVSSPLGWLVGRCEVTRRELIREHRLSRRIILGEKIGGEGGMDVRVGCKEHVAGDIDAE